MEAVKEKRLWECWISWLASWGSGNVYKEYSIYHSIVEKIY